MEKKVDKIKLMRSYKLLDHIFKYSENKLKKSKVLNQVLLKWKLLNLNKNFYYSSKKIRIAKFETCNIFIVIVEHWLIGF